MDIVFEYILLGLAYLVIGLGCIAVPYSIWKTFFGNGEA